MKVAITGGSGFVGRALISLLLEHGHDVKIWRRASSDLSFLDAWTVDEGRIQTIEGQLFDHHPERLLDDCDAVVHSGLWREDRSFQAAPSSLTKYLELNLLGSIELIEAAVNMKIPRFVFLSTCAVHDQILADRPLDEAHPLWAKTHYGSHKEPIEKFVHSYGLGQGVPICALRPTGIYGLQSVATNSKWYDLVSAIFRGEDVLVAKGGKEVHVRDVARAIELLLEAPADQIAGQAFSCYDHYVSQWEVANIAKRLCSSPSKIEGQLTSPKHEIDTSKIRSLGMSFGGNELLELTVKQLLASVGVGDS